MGGDGGRWYPPLTLTIVVIVRRGDRDKKKEEDFIEQDIGKASARERQLEVDGK